MANENVNDERPIWKRKLDEGRARRGQVVRPQTDKENLRDKFARVARESRRYPKVNNPRLEELCKAKTEEAVQVLAELLKHPSPFLRLKAAIAVLDRGWGKPVARVDVKADGGTYDEVLRASFQVLEEAERGGNGKPKGLGDGSGG